MIKLSTSRWVDYPGLFVGPQYNHECYYKREAEGNSTQSRERHVGGDGDLKMLQCWL